MERHLSLSIEDLTVYCIVTFKKIHAVYFKIKSNGILYVSSPHKYKNEIEAIILTKTRWIINHFKVISFQRKLITEETVFYLGNQLDIHWEQSEKRKQTYWIDSEVFTLQINNPQKKMIMLEYYLKQLTQSYIENILPHLRDKTGLIPKQVRYRKMKKWGACTKNGVLIFNSCLICLPISLIEYIVYHELVHLLHFNHSNNFHVAVATFLPDVKKLEKELKMYVR